MKASSILLLFSVAPLLGYTFTNPEGKSFDGEILRVQKDTVTIERTSDRRSFSMPIAKLSPADQAYATQWKKDNPDIRLTFNVVKESENNEVDGSNQESDDSFRIEVKNGNPEPTPALKLYYTITKRTTGDKELVSFDTSKEQLSGSLNIVPIPAFRSDTVTTSAVHVAKIASTTTTTTRDGSGQMIDNVITKKGQVALKGINLVVYFNNREVARWNTGGLQDQTVDLKAAGFTGKPAESKQ
jgi:hypothetical protein